MKKTKFTESKIFGILKEEEQAKKVADICRDHGIRQPTFYPWKSRYFGMDLSWSMDLIRELDKLTRASPC